MSEQTEPQRQLPITQIDELWAIAAKRWGDPGRRTPAPDYRFKELREHLSKIEALFDIDPEPHPVKQKVRPMKSSRKFPTLDDDDEIPF